MGHGWVTPNKDGHVARCGGPAICKTCQEEARVLKQLESERPNADEENTTGTSSCMTPLLSEFFDEKPDGD